MACPRAARGGRLDHDPDCRTSRATTGSPPRGQCQVPTASGRRLWGLRLIFKTPTRLRRRHARWPRRRLGWPVWASSPGLLRPPAPAPGSVSRQAAWGILGRLDSAHGNGLGDKTSVHDVPEVYCSAEGRPQSTPLSLRKAKPWRHRLERLSLRVHNRRGRLGVPLLPVNREQKPAPRRGDGTLAEILFGTHQTKRSGSVGTCGGAVALNDISMLVVA